MFIALLNTNKKFVFKTMLEILNNYVDNIIIDCQPLGIEIFTLDKSNNVLFNCVINNNYFIKYNCNHACAIGINIKSLLKILQCKTKNDQITMQYQEKSTMLEFIIENLS